MTTASSFKLSAEVPVYGSSRYTSYASWSRAFMLYTSVHPALQPAMSLIPLLPTDQHKAFAAYTVIEIKSNLHLRLVLHTALSEEQCDLICSEPRATCNLDRLRRMATASDLSHSSDLQVQLSTMHMTAQDTLQSYWSNGLTVQGRLNAASGCQCIFPHGMYPLPQDRPHCGQVFSTAPGANDKTLNFTG